MKRVFAVVLLALLTFYTIVGTVTAQNAQLYISNATARPGDMVEINVNLAIDNSFGASITLVYDNSRLTYISHRFNGVMGAVNHARNGEIRIAYASGDPIPAGTVISLQFSVNNNAALGAASIRFARTEVGGQNGLLNLNTANGGVTVQTVTTPPPTTAPPTLPENEIGCRVLLSNILTNTERLIRETVTFRKNLIDIWETAVIDLLEHLVGNMIALDVPNINIVDIINIITNRQR